MSSNKKLSRFIALIATASASLSCMHAQDTRTVVEPSFPATCSVLSSQLAISSGEPASETSFDTVRIQAALNACSAGQAVELQATGTSSAFLIQPLNIPSGVTLLVDGGVTVFASRNPADYQIAGQETCGTVGSTGKGCNPVISVNNNAASSGSGIMGYGIIDGRGQDKLLINGVASTSSWWDIANQAQTVGGSQNNPILLNVTRAAGFTLYKITFKNSPMFHVKWQNADGFTAWGVKVATPYTARNSDGIDPSGTNITVINSSISDGDDNIALSASSATSNITISNNNTYSGHGISVGSFTQGGLTNMLVTNINQAGTAADSNGIALRLKSALDRGGLVQNVTYRNICMQNHKTLIDIDPFYNSNAGNLVPQFSNILFQNVHGLTAGTITLEGHDVNHPTSVTLDNFVFDTLTAANISPAFQFDNITIGPGPVSPSFLQSQTGTGVTYTGNVTNPTAAPYPCSAASFTYLVGEMYLSTGTANNLQQSTLAGPGTFTLNAMLDPAMSGVTYGAYTGMPAPTAAVQFLEGKAVVGTASLSANGTLASATLTRVPTGAHTYTAYYPGDTTYAPFSFGSIQVTVVPTAAPSTISLSATPSTIQATGTTRLVATIAGTSLAAGPTGTVTFSDGVTPLGSAAVDQNSQASLTVALSGPGTHSITAVYGGDPNNANSTSLALPVIVTAIPTTTTVSLSSASVSAGAIATLTAVVSSQVGVPTGSVTFSSGTATLGTVALSNGVASFSPTSATPGVLSLSAMYTATGNYATSSSASVPLTFVAPVTLSLLTYETQVKAGSQVLVPVTATPSPGFAGVITFTCSSPGSTLTCSLTPASQTVSGAAAVQAVLAVTASATTSRLIPTDSRRVPVYAWIVPFGALLLIGVRRRTTVALLTLCIALLLSSVVVVGCASNPAAPTSSATAPQVVTVTAAEGALTQTTQLLVTVTK